MMKSNMTFSMGLLMEDVRLIMNGYRRVMRAVHKPDNTYRSNPQARMLVPLLLWGQRMGGDGETDSEDWPTLSN